MVLAVAGVVVAMISAALAVDLGRLAQDKRFDQKAADLAALDASRDLTQACVLAKKAVERNGFDPAGLVCSDPANNPADDVVIGTWSSGTFTPDPGGNAVKVVARSDFKAAFPFVDGVDGTEADAIAAAEDIAGFSVGSDLASVNTDENTTLNKVFTAMFGTSPAVDLTAVGYQGLAGGFVSLYDLAAADATLGSPDELLNSTVTVNQLAQAAVIALNNKGDDASVDAATFLATFAADIDTDLDLQLSDILSVQQPGNGSALDGQINVFDLLTTGAQAAQIANGDHLLTIPSLTVTVPGLTSSTLRLDLIEAPRIAFGPARADATSPTGWATWAQTAQIRIELDTVITVEVPPVCVNVPLVGLVCAPSALSLVLTLPIRLDAAEAKASLTDVRCAADVDDSEADIEVTTAAADATAALNLSAKLLGVPVVGLSPVNAHVVVPGAGADTLTFAGPFPTAVQSTGGTSVGLTAALAAQLTLGPLNVGAVFALLNPVTGAIDSQILAPLFDSLGVSLANADVRALAVGCGLPALVN